MNEEQISFARLEEIDIRNAWQHEALEFTPWLTANLEFLGDAIGLPLEAEASEVAVESFSADILAKAKFDDTKVLIENQLEVSDHIHLGQILTYAAGLDAKIVVWVASSFRDAHLSAINWLNENTDDSISFFAVRIKVVKIGDSPLAPVFEVVARPNEWERHVQAHLPSSRSRSELSEQRRSFWEYYVARVPGELEKGGPPSYLSNRYHILEVPKVSISLALAKNYVGLFIRPPYGEDPAETIDTLSFVETELEEMLGSRMGNHKQHFFETWTEGDFTSESDRERLADWLKEEVDRYERVLGEVFDR